MTLKYRHTILLVDDEEAIIKALKRLFRKDPYNILTARNGTEALDRLKDLDRPISLIISDQRMPHMTGAEFLERTRELAPNAIRFLLTGYTDMEAVIEAVNRGEIHRYLTKPWNNDDLRLQVRQALAQFELALENRRLLALTTRQNRELTELNKNLEEKVRERTLKITQQKEKLEAANRELESSFKSTISLLSGLFETVNPVLGRYMSHTARLARKIALESGLSGEEADQIEMAGMIHDVGLMGLPEKVWSKEEADMNEKELARFRQHPMIAKLCLSSVERLREISEIVVYHHEKWDGTGFPYGLQGEEIPLASRIIGVAGGYCRVVDIWPKESSRFIPLARSHMGNRALKEMEVREPDRMLEKIARKIVLLQADLSYDMNVVRKLMKVLEEEAAAGEGTLEAEKGKIIPVGVKDLREGMVLSKNLRLKDGRLLAQQGTRLKESSIRAIMNIAESQGVVEPILVTGRWDRPG